MTEGPLKWNEVWVGQLIREPGNPKRYRVVAIIGNPDRIIVRAVGGTNRRTIRRESLELAWFSAGATRAEEA
jgi:hypothetical protein